MGSQDMSEKLQKLMARAGIGSRRRCEELIASGYVTINGNIAKLGQRANPDIDQIMVNGSILDSADPIYIKLNKPKGVISSTEDELNKGRTTIRDLVPVKGHIYPIGRLDKQSEGLILLTNDGSITHRLTHPRYGHHKEYRVLVEGNPSNKKLGRWRRGVKLEGHLTGPVKIRVLRRDEGCTWLKIIMHEGRKRQIRRIAAGLGHPVIRLIRQRIGPISLGNLEPGAWRKLTSEEVSALRKTAFGR
jgi:23S rRNA pseudouridine2605 synthase